MIMLFVAGLVVIISGLVLSGNRLRSAISGCCGRWMSRPSSFGLIIALSCLPLLLAAILPWPGRQLILRGWREYCCGVRLGYGLAIAIGFVAAFLPYERTRLRALLVIGVFCSPVFFYLKGFEQMGLWSQRRLIPLTLLLIAGLTPYLSSVTARFVGHAGRWRWLAVPTVVCFLSCAGLSNPARWPAPYLVRHEKGTDEWVKTIKEKIHGRLACFDRYSYSVPFAVDGSLRCLGLSEYGFPGLAGVAKWLSERAVQEEVLWVTGFRNPGLEDGVILVTEEACTSNFWRVEANPVLPAMKVRYDVNVEFLKLVVIGDRDKPVMDKVLDGGVLGLRPPWGRSDIPVKLPNGRHLPAQWSREGSGIVGPVPRPGESVKISVVAVTGRTNPVETQTLIFQPPWQGEPLALTVGHGFTDTSGVLTRSAGAQNEALRTGTYRIYSANPYDPLKDGIRKFDNDLGALIHRIRIECITVDH